MIYVLALFASLAAILYNVLLDNMVWDYTPFVIFFSLVLFGIAIGGHLIKYSRFKYKSMSYKRFIAGAIVAVILAFSYPNYIEMWNEASILLQRVVMIWLAIVAIFIVTVPMVELNAPEDDQLEHGAA